VLDANTGVPIKADRSRLAASLQPSDRNHPHCLWVSVGSKGIRCIADITGDRVGKADWNNKVGGIENVQIVEKNGKCIPSHAAVNIQYWMCIGSCALVAFTDKNKAIVYSLPHLEYLQILDLPESDK